MNSKFFLLFICYKKKIRTTRFFLLLFLSQSTKDVTDSVNRVNEYTTAYYSVKYTIYTLRHSLGGDVSIPNSSASNN